MDELRKGYTTLDVLLQVAVEMLFAILGGVLASHLCGLWIWEPGYGESETLILRYLLILVFAFVHGAMAGSSCGHFAWLILMRCLGRSCRLGKRTGVAIILLLYSCSAIALGLAYYLSAWS